MDEDEDSGQSTEEKILLLLLLLIGVGSAALAMFVSVGMIYLVEGADILTPAPTAAATVAAPSVEPSATAGPGTPATGTPPLGTPTAGTPTTGTPPLGTPALGTPPLGTPTPLTDKPTPTTIPPPPDPPCDEVGTFPTICIEDGTVSIGETVSVRVWALNMPPAGLNAWIFNVFDDSGVFVGVNCDVPQRSTCSLGDGVAFFIEGSSSSGLSGDAVLARIDVRCSDDGEGQFLLEADIRIGESFIISNVEEGHLICLNE